MNPERWQQIKRLYNSALELEPDRRQAFLQQACSGDESLRKETERLLAQEAEAEDLLGTPAFEFAARALAQDRTDEPLPDFVGRSLLHYRITEKIGEGGMGVVYKARDTHLDRTVAIKVLPAEAVADPERKRRFIQEAKAASALNHPNIIDIHDINSDAGVDFIVMEHVPGKTLDRRIGRKGLRVGEALKYAVQIADALASAHTAGIVHRDLKPANIMVTETGLVKVLDFGLAKLTQPLESEVSATASAMKSLTGEGRIIGTVAYMSPEQAEGKAVDARSDIFSFGSVLYEMISGKQPFQADSTLSTLSAILNKEAGPLSAGIPHDLERIVTRCLRKDPARRFQAMADLKVELEELKNEAESGRLQVLPAVVKRVSPFPLAVVAVTVVALIVAGWYWLRPQRSATPEAVLTPVPLTSYPGFEWFPSFSPDGMQVAFEWCKEGPGLDCDIYVKQIGVEPPSRLTSDPAMDCCPAWSPDGNLIAFLRRVSPTRAALLTTPQRGGQERVLGETDLKNLAAPFLAWTPDSKWLAFPDATGPGLFLLSVQTGEKRKLTEHDDTRPAFSPDGRTLAFTHEGTDIYLLRLLEGFVPRGAPEKLRSAGDESVGLAWTPDGSEIVYSHGIWNSSSLWRMPPSASANPRRLPFGSENGCFPAVSQHGNRLAYVVSKYDGNIWRVDLGKAGLNPRPAAQLIPSTRTEACPAYSPDGSKIAFFSDRSGAHELWVCNSDGLNPVQLTSCGGVDNGPKWSPDGRTIVFTAYDGRYQYIYLMSANGGIPHRLTTDPAVDKWPYWSRDGQSVYFASMRSGMSEIWRMPATGGKAVQITPNGERRDIPQESPDGRFLYYLKWDEARNWYSSVWRMPVGGGEETKVLDSGCYRVREPGIYFLRPPDERGLSDICLREFATGKTRKILTIAAGFNRNIEVSPDGRTILYGYADRTGSDLMLVENFR
jgi:serine/threonine protein kinase/dipeptidyl aminopeptidase/acylaminoacyl peptidase